MKKFVIALIVGMFLCSINMDAGIYRVKHGSDNPHPRPWAPALYQIGVYVDSETGDLYICPNYDISDLNITIAQGGVVYEQTTVSLSAGQAYETSVAGYDEAEYTLTLTDGSGNVIDQYIITVEDD